MPEVSEWGWQMLVGVHEKLCFWTQFLWFVMFWVDFFILFLFFKDEDISVIHAMEKNLQNLCGRNQLPVTSACCCAALNSLSALLLLSLHSF